jgi:hypothetical protein
MRRSLHSLLRSVWVVALLATLMLPGSRLAAQSADLYISSTPQGAEITINGKTAGVTPLTLPAVHPGQHLLSGALRGYRTVYQTLEISGGERQVLDLALEPLHGLLLVHSTPQGADVEINGVHRGTTPVMVADLAFGIHRAQLSKSGYLPRQLDIVIASRVPQRIATALTADTATLTVNTTPPGAEVTIDGVRAGVSPCEIADVRTGEVRLGINAAGHHSFEETLALQAGEVRQLDISLRPEPSALRITTTPPDARIVLNDQYRGRSPVDIAPLAAGTYTLRVELTAHDPAERTVRLGLGQHRVEELVLTPNAGRLELTTEPAGAKVLLDGMPVGETEPVEDGTDKLSALFTLPLVPVGTHELTLTKPGYYPLTEEITVVRNETLTRHFALSRRFIPNCQVQTEAEVYRGVLIERNPTTLKLELRPGIFKTLRLADVTSITPLLNAPAVPADEGDKP